MFPSLFFSYQHDVHLSKFHLFVKVGVMYQSAMYLTNAHSVPVSEFIGVIHTCGGNICVFCVLSSNITVAYNYNIGICFVISGSIF